jgi:hypothetical protein
VYQVGNKDKIKYTEMHGQQNIKISVEVVYIDSVLELAVLACFGVVCECTGFH